MKLKSPTTVFINGCFDILHPGHIKLFESARSFGDHVVVAIDSDRRVQEMKGPSRPIKSEYQRKTVLASIRYIDEVHVFDTKEELEALVKKIKPDIMIVGSDWKGKEVVGSQYAKELRFFDRIENYSTTKIVEDIIDRGKL
jgi:D-beta-D-heptose 7-phosphate kinase/D-beta-D-heptose 1-phosphate adenosyltransferase